MRNVSNQAWSQFYDCLDRYSVSQLRPFLSLMPKEVKDAVSDATQDRLLTDLFQWADTPDKRSVLVDIAYDHFKDDPQLLQILTLWRAGERGEPEQTILPQDPQVDRVQLINGFRRAFRNHQWTSADGQAQPLVVIVQGEVRQGHISFARRLCGQEGTVGTGYSHVGTPPLIEIEGDFRSEVDVVDLVRLAASRRSELRHPHSTDYWKEAIRQRAVGANRFISCLVVCHADRLDLGRSDFLLMKPFLDFWTGAMTEIQVRLVHFVCIVRPPIKVGIWDRLRSSLGLNSPPRLDTAIQCYMPKEGQRPAGQHYDSRIVVLPRLSSLDQAELETLQTVSWLNPSQRAAIKGYSELPYDDLVDLLNMHQEC